jgi:hypothetical protein
MEDDQVGRGADIKDRQESTSSNATALFQRKGPHGLGGSGSWGEQKAGAGRKRAGERCTSEACVFVALFLAETLIGARAKSNEDWRSADTWLLAGWLAEQQQQQQHAPDPGTALWAAARGGAVAWPAGGGAGVGPKRWCAGRGDKVYMGDLIR